MSKKVINYVMQIVGIIIVLFSVYFWCVYNFTYSWLMLGIGAGLLGAGIAGVFSNWYERKNPKQKRLKDIAVNDERNKFIHYKTGSKMYNISLYETCVIMLILSAFKAPTWIIFLLVGIVIVNAILYVLIFNKDYK